MNRRTFYISLTATFLGLSPLAFAKKKKGKNKDKEKEDPNAIKTITGTVTLKERSITKNYRLVGNKSYSFARAHAGRVKQFVDQKVTVAAKVKGNRILVLESIIKAK